MAVDIPGRHTIALRLADLAEDIRMQSRVHSVHATHHVSAATAAIVVPRARQRRGSCAKNAEHYRHREANAGFVDHCRISWLNPLTRKIEEKPVLFPARHRYGDADATLRLVVHVASP